MLSTQVKAKASDPKPAANEENLPQQNRRLPVLNLSALKLPGTLCLQVKAFMQHHPQALSQALFFAERCAFAAPAGRPRLIERELCLLQGGGCIPAARYADFYLKEGKARRRPLPPPAPEPGQGAEKSFFILPVGAMPVIYQALIDLHLYARLRSFREQLPELEKIITLICLQVLHPEALLTASSCQELRAQCYYLTYLKDPQGLAEKLGRHYAAVNTMPREQAERLKIKPDFCYLRLFDTPVGVLPQVRLVLRHSFEWQQGTIAAQRLEPLPSRPAGTVFLSDLFKELSFVHALLILRDVDLSGTAELKKALNFGSKAQRNKHYVLLRLTAGLHSPIFASLGWKRRPQITFPELAQDCILRRYVHRLDNTAAPDSEKCLGRQGYAALIRQKLPRLNCDTALYLHVFYSEELAQLELARLTQQKNQLQQHWLRCHELPSDAPFELTACINHSELKRPGQALCFKAGALEQLYLQRCFHLLLSPIELPLEVLYTCQKQCREQDLQMQGLFRELQSFEGRGDSLRAMHYLQGRCLISWCAQLLRRHLCAGLLHGRALEQLSLQEADALLDSALHALRSLELIVEGGGVHLSLPQSTAVPGFGALDLPKLAAACSRVLRKTLKSPQFQGLQTLSGDELSLLLPEP